jgi:putative ABC transport system permease protein
MSDLRFALRLLWKDKTFALTALLTLAITIGANTAIFSIVRSILLKPLPVPDSERIVFIYNSYPNAGAPRAEAAVPDYFDRLRETTVFDEQALYRRQDMTLGAKAGAAAERIRAVRATPSFFRLIHAVPLHGQLFTEADGEEGHERKVVLSHDFWRRQFGGEPGAVGRDLRLNGVNYTIQGVLPPRFTFLWQRIDVWVPAAFTAREKSDDSRHSNNWQMIGRLKPDATVALAQQQVDAINARNDERFPQFRQILKDAGFHSVAVLLQNDVVREIRPVLYLLWGGVLFVLLLGCVNIANLVMVRSSVRAREIATRTAIGASRARLARQLFTETTFLAVLGGALGIFFGWWGLRSITALRLEEIPRGYEIALDPVAVAVVFGLAIVVGLAIGLMPLARLFRLDVNVALREEGRGGTSGRGAAFARRALATAQVAIAFVLLIGAGLMFASFRQALGINPGFESSGVVTAAVSLPQANYKDDPALVTFWGRLLASLRAEPGVEAAGLTTIIPFGGDFSSSVILAEGYQMKPGESLISPTQTIVSDGYFETMKIPLVRGRSFKASDTATSPRVVIVDERLARKFWPDRDPIGRRMYLPENTKDVLAITPETKFLEVVGVVKEVQLLPPGAPFDPVGAYYFPYSQTPERAFVVSVRTSLDPEALTNTVRKTVMSIDPELPVFDVRTMAARFDEALISRRVPMLIAVAFGVVALFLSAIGIYGVLAYGVTQRRREIGIRMALGSTRGQVFGLVLGDGARIVGIGLALGLAGAYFVGKAMEKQLFQVAPSDPWVIATVIVTLSAIALIAVAIPARRAARVNPTVTLNQM